VGASTSHNPKGLQGLYRGKLYLYLARFLLNWTLENEERLMYLDSLLNAVYQVQVALIYDRPNGEGLWGHFTFRKQ
jgi:hypothetical protein